MRERESERGRENTKEGRGERKKSERKAMRIRKGEIETGVK